MKAVILAGGQELLRCPLGMVRPRALFPLIGGTLLDRLLGVLASVDVDEAIICANGKTRVLHAHFRDRAPMKLRFHDDGLPRGPAGCIKDVADSLARGTFLVLEAGLFLDGDLRPLIREHKKHGSAITLGAVPLEQWNSGDGTDTDDGPLSPLGVFVAEPDILEHIPEHGYYDVKEQLIPKLLEAGLATSYARYRGKHRRIRDAHSYAALVHDVLGGVFGDGDFASLKETGPRVWIGENVQLDPSAVLIGPVVVGANAVIGRGAVIAGPALVGENVTIHDMAYVNSSILWASATIGYGARVEHAIVTDSFHVADRACLMHCVAVNRDMKLGDVHGLRLGGYDVDVVHRAEARAGNGRPTVPQLAGLLRSPKAMGRPSDSSASLRAASVEPSEQ